MGAKAPQPRPEGQNPPASPPPPPPPPKKSPMTIFGLPVIFTDSVRPVENLTVLDPGKPTGTDYVTNPETHEIFMRIWYPYGWKLIPMDEAGRIVREYLANGGKIQEPKT